MFVVESLMVVSVVYWFSALIAELLLVSNNEQSLPVVIRTSFGFFFSALYFAAAWQIAAIGYVWLFGIFLLLLNLYGKDGSQFISITALRINKNIREHVKYYLIFLIGASIFFAPLFVAKNYGPFSEGGGDVSIYADVSHVLARGNLTEYGKVGELSNVSDNIKDVFDSADRNRVVDYSVLNPPLAEVSVNRIIVSQSMGVFMYAPFAQYYFLAGVTNYHVYYGILAFIYCIILAGVWCFFKPFGNKSAVLALLVALFSHGLISVFYNMYAAQAFSLAFSILVLNALPYIRLNSWAGLRTYGVGGACLWSMYSHFLAVVIPLVLSAWGGRYFKLFEINKAESYNALSAKSYQKISKTVSELLFSGLFILFLIGGSKKTLVFLHGIINGLFNSEGNPYMGEQASLISSKFASFVFGVVSQQHYLPYVEEYKWLNEAVLLGVLLGGCALLLGGILMLKIYTSDFYNNIHKGYFIIYFLLMVAIVPHLYLSQMSLYTQAKGAQNALIYLYGILMLPLAIGLSIGNKEVAIGRLTKLLLMIVALFCLTIAVPRVVFGLKLAFNQDRGSILELSYFAEAERIKKNDPAPYVLFEPRKSADLYLSDEPFFGFKMIPTRHLFLQWVDHGVNKDILGSELITNADVEHLWLLSSVKKDRWQSQGVYDYIWRAERLRDKKEPDILLMAGNYERNFGNRALGAATGKTGMFSYVRNGAATLYLPAGIQGNLEVMLEPTDANDYDKLVKEVQGRIHNGEFGKSAELSLDGKVLTLSTKIFSEQESTLKTIAHYGGEFWLNVRFNTKDL